MEFRNAVLRSLIKTLEEPLSPGEPRLVRVRVVSQLYRHLVSIADQGIEEFARANPGLFADSAAKARFARFLESIRAFHLRTFPNEPVAREPQFNQNQLVHEDDLASVSSLLQSLDIGESEHSSSSESWEAVDSAGIPTDPSTSNNKK